MNIIDRGRPAATVPTRPAATLFVGDRDLQLPSCKPRPRPAAPFPAPTDRQKLAGLRAEWRRVARQLADPAVDLDSDEFVAVLNVYSRLKAAGSAVDPMAEAFILQGCQQLAAASL